MQCPRCNVGLKETAPGEYGFITLDICSNCNGAWFDKGELDRLDERVAVDAEQEIQMREPVGNHKELDCPSCDGKLEAISPVDAPELIIDRCPACRGFWLDEGELEKMQDVVAREAAEYADNMTHYRQPPGWSNLKYIIYCFKTFR